MFNFKIFRPNLAAIPILTAVFAVMASPCWATSPPTINYANGIYSQPGVNGPIQISAPAGSIYFTTDGSQPTAASTQYSTGFYAGNGINQVNAIAINAGVSSTVTSAFIIGNGNAYNIPFPNNWYLNCFGPAASGKIADWPDMSFHSADALQATSTKQPSIVQNSISGQGAIAFNGSSTYLTVPSQTFTNSGITIFAVINPTTTVANAQIVNFSAATAPQNLIGLGESSTKAAQFSVYNAAGTSSTVVAAPSALTANNYQLVEVVQGDISSTIATLYINSSQVAQNTAMNVIPAASLANNFIAQYSGGSEYFKGNIAELMVYTTPLTEANRTIVESYLTSKYQLAFQVPTAPIFSNSTSTLTAPAQVAIAAQPGAVIHMTTDGTTPSSTSPIYSGPVQINYTLTLKAIAIENSLSSPVTSANYTLDSQFPAPATGGPTLQINVTVPAIGIP